MTTCIRGCTIHGQHLTDCPGECTGCLPRPAHVGLLCRACYERLNEFLSTDSPTSSNHPRSGLVLARYWVDYCLDRGIVGIAYDGDRVGVSKTPPAPVNLARIDWLRDLDDTMSSWLEAWCAHRGLAGPDLYRLETACGYLGSWLDEIASWEPVADLWDELARLMSRAHALAPWRAEAHRCEGVACPECGRAELVVYDGEDVVTCRACGVRLHRDEYARWTAVLADEARPKPLSYWAATFGKTSEALRRAVRRDDITPDATDRNGRKLFLRSTLEAWLRSA